MVLFREILTFPNNGYFKRYEKVLEKSDKKNSKVKQNKT